MEQHDRTSKGPPKGLPTPLIVGAGLVALAAATLLLAPNGAKVRKSGEPERPSPLPSAEIVRELRVAPASSAIVASDPTATGGPSPADGPGDSSEAVPTAQRLKADDVAVFMRAKLDHSQDVIKGLAMEDYQAIYRAAHDLALASQASTWEVLLTEEYARQSAEFRRSCESLRKAARDENLDAAALAWMDVTMKCVQCHKYVRQADDEDR